MYNGIHAQSDTKCVTILAKRFSPFFNVLIEKRDIGIERQILGQRRSSVAGLTKIFD